MTASPNEAKKNDWLEYADDKYDKHAISDLRLALDVTYLFIPLPLFYTLFDQQVSYHLTLRYTYIMKQILNKRRNFSKWFIITVNTLLKVKEANK